MRDTVQGTDPATDLRSCGMLGLLQLLALWHHSPRAAAAIAALSRHPVQNFPLAPLGINFTATALTALKRARATAAPPRFWFCSGFNCRFQFILNLSDSKRRRRARATSIAATSTNGAADGGTGVG